MTTIYHPELTFNLTFCFFWLSLKTHIFSPYLRKIVRWDKAFFFLSWKMRRWRNCSRKNKLKDNFLYCKWIVHIKNTGLCKFKWVMVQVAIKASGQDLKPRKGRKQKQGICWLWGTYFGGPFAGLITYTCKKDESYLTAQSTLLQLTKNIR